MLGFAGVSLFGPVDFVRRVETRAEQFLLALAVAASHGLECVKVNRLFFLLLFHLVKIVLALNSVNKFSRQDDVVLVDGSGKQRSNLLIPEAGDATADAGHEELELGMGLGELDELVHIGLDGFHATLHGGDGVTLSLQPNALAPHGAKAVIGGTGGPTAMHSAQVAAEHKDFILL